MVSGSGISFSGKWRESSPPPGDQCNESKRARQNPARDARPGTSRANKIRDQIDLSPTDVASQRQNVVQSGRTYYSFGTLEHHNTALPPISVIAETSVVLQSADADGEHVK